MNRKGENNLVGIFLVVVALFIIFGIGMFIFNSVKEEQTTNSTIYNLTTTGEGMFGVFGKISIVLIMLFVIVMIFVIIKILSSIGGNY